MRVVARLHGLILAVMLLQAPAAVAQRGAHPVHESNIELCRSVWQGQPEKVERCLVARRDLVETLERNPYAHPPKAAVSTPCHGWRKGYAEKGGLPRTITERCDRSLIEEAAALSFWFNHFHSVVADAVMWDDQHRASDARRSLGRLEWCDSKYRPDAESTNYHDVLECADLSIPRYENRRAYKFGPRE